MEVHEQIISASRALQAVVRLTAPSLLRSREIKWSTWDVTSLSDWETLLRLNNCPIILLRFECSSGLLSSVSDSHITMKGACIR
jgi:hypothetical protein